MISYEVDGVASSPRAVLGRYELLVPIAKGGMAQVWAARLRGTRGFQKLYAVKTILPDSYEEAQMESMLLREAELAAAIRHPNVVETLELGEERGTLYLVMEWIDGVSLAVLSALTKEQGGPPLEVSVNLVAQVCRGLHAAHELSDDEGAPLGIVHRDVSPQNILVTDAGVAKLVDFGIAKAMNRSSNTTQHQHVQGKFSYIAPEQFRGEQVDRRADVFALGIILYSLTTGRHPFRGDTPVDTLRRICSDAPPPRPTELVPEYPVALEAVVMRALAKAKEARFATAFEFLQGLHRALPSAFDVNFEERLRRYLKGLLAEPQRERHAALRAAQAASREEPASQQVAIRASAGSIRPCAVDHTETLIPEQEPPANSLRWAKTQSSFPLADFRPAWKRHGASVGILALLAMGLLVSQWGTGSSGQPSAQATVLGAESTPRDFAVDPLARGRATQDRTSRLPPGAPNREEDPVRDARATSAKVSRPRNEAAPDARQSEAKPATKAGWSSRHAARRPATARPPQSAQALRRDPFESRH